MTYRGNHCIQRKIKMNAMRALLTLIAEVEKILNDRSTTQTSDDSRDPEPLKPKTLLLLRQNQLFQVEYLVWTTRSASAGGNRYSTWYQSSGSDGSGSTYQFFRYVKSGNVLLEATYTLDRINLSIDVY